MEVRHGSELTSRLLGRSAPPPYAVSGEKNESQWHLHRELEEGNESWWGEQGRHVSFIQVNVFLDTNQRLTRQSGGRPGVQMVFSLFAVRPLVCMYACTVCVYVCATH